MLLTARSLAGSLAQCDDERTAILAPGYAKAARRWAKREHLADQQRAVAGGVALLEDEPAVRLAAQGEQDEVVVLHDGDADARGEVALGERAGQPQVPIRRDLAGRVLVEAHARSPAAEHSSSTISTTRSIP
ncbi:MAG: hypothetical protein Q8O56_13000 [Solirubrobacteraceae bacterium]|nr:hypothetical protein [Solirubrobacteraceae bacterium]